LSLFQKVQTGSRAYPASYSVGTGVISPGYSGRRLMVTTKLHLAPKLRMSASITLLPNNACMA